LGNSRDKRDDTGEFPSRERANADSCRNGAVKLNRHWWRSEPVA
jgi:hypothetical protein